MWVHEVNVMIPPTHKPVKTRLVFTGARMAEIRVETQEQVSMLMLWDLNINRSFFVKQQIKILEGSKHMSNSFHICLEEQQKRLVQI